MPSENEKLHALLLEARGVARRAYEAGFSDALTDAGVTKIVAMFIPGASFAVEEWEDTIDAALAASGPEGRRLVLDLWARGEGRGVSREPTKEEIAAALAEPMQSEADRLLAQLEKMKCASGKAGNSSDCGCEPCREAFRILDKFNTARAMGEVSLLSALEKAQRERDEARAEVRRLKAESKMERGFTDSYIKLLHKAEAKAKDAYQRGAEAMREAAAAAVYDTHTTGLLAPAAVTAAVRVIRRLPTPEDK